MITITLNNLSSTDSEQMDIVFAEKKPSEVTASILTNEMHAYNTFENPENVKEEVFTKFTINEQGISFTIPACSVVQLRVK